MTPQDLKALRIRLGYTQAQLAEVIGVTVTTVARWEQGQRPVSKPIAKLLALIELEL